MIVYFITFTPLLPPSSQAFLNGVDVPGIFLLRTLVAKLVGAIGSVAGGLAIGKEGPFVHAGAGIASLLGQVWERTRGWGQIGPSVEHQPIKLKVWMHFLASTVSVVLQTLQSCVKASLSTITSDSYFHSRPLW
jgi:hypothetical protein